ncbi:tumor necrosis factor receptor superfamily member 14-like isoform X1 [Chanodichthys erythropterus]|uniref:tumor necrosis factor receptor superfamily member 14-like isoform X1 n=1 Tax=Chanodichthys erythropterus TaxID=933992 RepID=UPI00351DB4FD
MFMDMLLLRTIISTVGIVIAVHFELCFCGCSRAEYEINGECCPMCGPGNRVYWHCTVDTSTSCIPCPAATYTDEPNGLITCFSCTVCAAVQGLRVRKACTRSADTICEPQEGFHCIALNKGNCKSAVEHAKCKPGQYIKQKGTAFTDTVCANCTDGTYSNGSLMACQPHSKCEIKGLTEIKAGTSSSDAECKKVTSVKLIVGVTVPVLVTVLVALIGYIIYRKHKAQPSNKRVKPQQATEDDSELKVETLLN